MMKNFLLGFIAGLSPLLFSCVRSGGTECRSYVRFVYDYNMAYEDLFHNQACKMDLYMFDDSGIFVDVISHELTEGTFPRGYRILLPEGLPYPLHFVAWSGVHPTTCRATEMVPGISARSDLVVQMNEYRDNIFEDSLRGLWHGTGIKETENTTLLEDETVIYLTKNTNSIRVILQVLENDDLVPELDNFSVSLESINGSYDHTNTVYYDHPWTYRPFYSALDADVGAVTEIHTLRLMEDSRNILTISFGPDGQVVLEVDLNRYINALKLQSYEWMPLQEYMDREDEYRVIIFLKYIDNTWIAENVSLNEWVVREPQEVD